MGLSQPVDVDDRLSQTTLGVIAAVIDRLPEEFELGHQQATQSSITSTLRFTGGMDAQLDHMEAILKASTVTPTLYRNLMAARRLLQSVIAEGDPGDELLRDIRHFLSVA